MEAVEVNEVVSRWAEMTVRIWEDKIRALGITDTMTLLNSFQQHIVANAGGNVGYVEFAYAYYGRLVDMGVGRGVTRDEVYLSNRRPRPWYSSTFLLEVKKLANILADQYASKANLAIVNGIRSGDTGTL